MPVDFDLQGEDFVRESVRIHRYAGQTHEAAKAWLIQKDAERKASNIEAAAALKSARNAAWVSAISAVLAVLVAIGAILF